MNGERNRRTEIEELLNLVRFDYEQSLRIIDGIVRVSTSIRAIATTVWVGLLAASIQTNEWALAAIGAAATGIFALLDGYHGWLYGHASERAYKQEKLIHDYYKYLQRSGDRESESEILKQLRSHEFGQLSHFPGLDKLHFYCKAKPPFFYHWFYPALAGVAVGVAIAVGVSQSGTTDDLEHTSTAPKATKESGPKDGEGPEKSARGREVVP